MTSTGVEWWRGEVLYNVYPRSWQDSDGDGHGDLPGVVQRLEHLAWLGISGLWLNPITASANRDWGYDVVGYTSVQEDLGTLADVDELVAEAGARGIRVVLDLVPSHTSDEHPWFHASRAKSSPFRDYYVWRPPSRDGGPPNNWMSYFGGSAWTLDEGTGMYYLHNFSQHQPQLNWWNAQVVSEFDRIFRFWFDRGIGGMRLDALQALFYDRRLRENPPANASDTINEQRVGQRFAFNANRPETHAVVRRWRSLARSYEEPRLLFGETWVPSLGDLAAYYGDGDELDLAWNLPFLSAPFSASELGAVIAETLASLPQDASPAWAMSTHDGEGRGPSRWCGGRESAARSALLLLLTLPGTPILYYGDEIAMTDAAPGIMRGSPRDTSEPDSRDRSRTPMQWDATPSAGFTSSGQPWLPVGEARAANVRDQARDPDSVLHLCRRLVAARREHPSLSGGEISLRADAGVLAFERGGELAVLVNLAGEAADVGADGTVLLATDRAREGQRVRRSLRLEPYEGVVVARARPSR